VDLPVEIHCHGIAHIDFSALEGLDLRSVEAAAAAEKIVVVPTIFLARAQLDRFVEVAHEYDVLSCAGELPHIAGLALEGPLLASAGGTPSRAAWLPTAAEWIRLASCGARGLRYVVLSPDFASQHSSLGPGCAFTLQQAVEALIDHGVAPALGHFTRGDPMMSAEHVEEILSINERRGRPVTVLTDHLFNDMPLAFRHAWRGRRGEREREAAISEVLEQRWDAEDLDTMIGIVPATLIRAAARGELMLCLNFDGEHVDPVYCGRTVELAGSEAIVAMTDRTEVDRLAGEPLHRLEASNLWYQDGDVVAAGSTPVGRQAANMRALGLSEDVVRQLTVTNPRRVLGLHVRDATEQ
jgi:N-acetylglucosamine-6-phosphate deacetylase